MRCYISTYGNSDFILETLDGKQWDLASNTTDGSFTIYQPSTSQIRFAVSNSGNVGIGTVTPSNTLHVIGSISASTSSTATNNSVIINGGNTTTAASTNVNRLRFGGSDINADYFTIQGPYNADYLTINTGKVGIGTTNPATLLSVYKSTSSGSYGGYTTAEVNNPNTSGDANAAFVLRSGTVTAAGVSGAVGGLYSKATNNANQYIWLRSFSSSYPVYIGTNQSDLAIVNGNVLIGQTDQSMSYKLNVKGSVRADKVTVNTSGADFVFDSSYKLMSLDTLNTFVQKNHHLPGISPASEMQKDGIDLGENQTKLLQKIEELTLYIIELKKENTEIQKENREIKEELKKNFSKEIIMLYTKPK